MLRTTVFIAFLILFMLFSCDSQDQKSAREDESGITTVDKQKVYYYTCPMNEHKHVYNDKPGECPECRMELVAAVAAPVDSVEFYGCPMPIHSHIRHDKAGKCEECGMDLKPMRLSSGH